MWRDSWAFITVKRGLQGMKHAEVHNHTTDPNRWGQPVIAQTYVELRPAEETTCNWRGDKEFDRRKSFCDKYDGYKGICNCE